MRALVRSVALGAVLVGVCAGAAARDGAPRVGLPYPDFSLPSIDGGAEVRLSDFRGKKILLFHFASW